LTGIILGVVAALAILGIVIFLCKNKEPASPIINDPSAGNGDDRNPIVPREGYNSIDLPRDQ
jgi:hypothetical protein